MKFIFGLIILSVFNYVFSANIFYMAGVPSPSHHIWNKAFALGLIEKGHNITMLSQDTEKKPIKNLNIILFEDLYRRLYENVTLGDLVKGRQLPFSWLYIFYDWIMTICQLDFETEGLKTIMNYPDDFFDLIIWDASCAPCLAPIIDKFQKPVIAVTPFLIPFYLSEPLGHHWFTSYMPHYGTAFTHEMTFLERLETFLTKHIDVFIRSSYYPLWDKQAESYFGPHRGGIEYERNFTLLLANIDPILNYPISLPPNIIPVGGLHARKSLDLPEDLRDIMDNAKEGVILFSLGTNIHFSDLDENVRTTIIKTLGRLKQTVIWKLTMDIDNLPKNVIVRKWLPQNDMMNHPNLKLFITHGGALSIQEAMCHGIPVLVIPFFADQIYNAATVTSKNVGGYIEVGDIAEELFFKRIQEIITNPKYSENMKKLSAKYKAQPQTALERAVFWTEYILKHGPADEFAPPTKNMSFVEIFNLDVIAFLLATIVVILYVLRKVFCFLLGKVFCKNVNKDDIKNKKVKSS